MLASPSKRSSAIPQPLTTHVSGSSANSTGMPVSWEIILSKSFNSAPPPVRTIPFRPPNPVNRFGVSPRHRPVTGVEPVLERQHRHDEVPLGHGEKSVIMLMECGVPLTLEEKVMIRWHMAEFDAGEWKLNRDNVMKQYPNVFWLQKADQIASHMEDVS
jgi:hypothetical protein